MAMEWKNLIAEVEEKRQGDKKWKQSVVTHLKGHQDVDELAGEQGPLCHTLMEQIPNIKLIHIRLLDKPSSAYLSMFSLKGVEDNNDSGSGAAGLT